eukprot:gnl/MRDRNA2_/MRDRNA2_124695_c0_seq1.p1 gnl/MRDRNA2_/MRDRNA2_124695_c0~~gnl/MRDRNA2_/MRDRNA2_124695_c0_seq1.p1  ORF type:complete len:473 (-),score=61.52 gnl/MRDRNA2_/MRDRNA2_124695_c0_seq1:86-1504(-)
MGSGQPLLLLPAHLTAVSLLILLNEAVKPVAGAVSAQPMDKLTRHNPSQDNQRLMLRPGQGHSSITNDWPALSEVVRTPVVQDKPDAEVLAERDGKIHTGEHTFWPPDQGNGLTAWIFAFFFVLMIASVPVVLHFMRVKSTFSLVLLLEGVALFIWLVVGLVCFTQFVMFQSPHFGDDFRTLTLVEAVYLFAQILTTVGYGDITPAYAGGQFVVACFVFVAIILIAELISELSTIVMERAHKHVEMALEQAASAVSSETEAGSRDKQGVIGQRAPSPKSLLISTLAFVLFVAIGTCFFHLYPGEGKTWGQGLYMSIITLTTVGFGAFTAETEAGKVFGSFWMVLGVLSLGGVVTAFTEYMIFLREKEQSQQYDSAAEDVLHQECVDHHGRVDQLGFLRYALMKYHIAPKDEVDGILKQFEALDRDHRGTVSAELVKQLSMSPAARNAGRHGHRRHSALSPNLESRSTFGPSA